MNNQRVRPETNGAGNGGRERPEGVLAPAEQSAVAALAAAGTTGTGAYVRATAPALVGPVTLTASSAASSGSAAVVGKSIDLTVNQTGTASGVSTALKVNITETAALGQTRLLDLQVGGASRFVVLGTAPITSAAGAVWEACSMPGFTQTIKGNTTITAVFAKHVIKAATLTSDTATCAINWPSTLFVDGPPTMGTNTSAAKLASAIRIGETTSLSLNPAQIYSFSNSGMGILSYNVTAGSYALLAITASTVVLNEGCGLQVGTTTGTKIGTAGGASGQKLGFWNATPIVQPVLATGAGATVDNVITTLQTLGLCRQS